MSHVTLLSIESKDTGKSKRQKFHLQLHNSFAVDVSMINLLVVCKCFCPQFVNVDSGENRGVIPTGKSDINENVSN